MEKATPKWDRHSILAALRRNGKQLNQLALDHERNPNSFRQVWTRPNRINEKIIADFLNEPVEQLFPDRYPKPTSHIFDSTVSKPSASPKSDLAAHRSAA